MEENDGSNGESDAASSLDHALLESLFYNEMLMMEDPLEPVLAAPDMALLSSPAGTNAAPAVVPEPLIMPDSMLLNHPQNMACVSHMNGSIQNAAMPQPWAVSSGVPPPVPHSLPVHAAAARAGQPVATTMPIQQVPVTVTLLEQAIHGQPVQTAASEVSQERATQLVSQFATLASRLGISLPPNVLSSLTVAAAANEAQSTGTSSASLPPAEPLRTAPDSTLSSATARPVTNDPPKVKELESTAEAAIAAVNETRKRKEEAPATSSGSRPLYSKRRKKPRLSDCEAKLAALRSENEMLKRHLANVTNKAQAFDQNREQATQEMKRMIQENAPPEKLNPLLHKFSEMYSDYGRHRHQELTFHLDQLEK